MANPKIREARIEFYLQQLERELKPLSVALRSEIITDTKTRLHAMVAAQPQSTIDQIFVELGSPRTMAEAFLKANGVQPVPRRKANGGRFFKWLAVGTVAFFGLVFCLGLALTWYFSPLIKVDEKNGRVVLLGGLIDINESLGLIKVGDVVVNDFKNAFQVAGQQAVSLAEVTKLNIPFNTARLAIETSMDGRLKWDCQAATDRQPKVEINAGVLTLNLDVLSLAKCEIFIPKGLQTEVRGVNGNMDVNLADNSMIIALDNGRVKIHSDPNQIYDYDVKVKNGLQDLFPRSKAKNAVKVKVSVVNGLVKKEE